MVVELIQLEYHQSELGNKELCRARQEGRQVSLNKLLSYFFTVSRATRFISCQCCKLIQLQLTKITLNYSLSRSSIYSTHCDDLLHSARCQKSRISHNACFVGQNCSLTLNQLIKSDLSGVPIRTWRMFGMNSVQFRVV